MDIYGGIKMSNTKNSGKRFEEDFFNSVDKDKYFIYRLKDSAQSYNNSKETKFTWNNPCDFFIYNCKSHILYAIECKSTKFKSMNFQLDEKDINSKMIKYHQIKSLTDFSMYDGIIPCFLLNFRDEEHNMERTYFIHIKNYNNMIKTIKKKSFNEIDLILYGAVKIEGKKKRIRYYWNMDKLFSEAEV